MGAVSARELSVIALGTAQDEFPVEVLNTALTAAEAAYIAHLSKYTESTGVQDVGVLVFSFRWDTRLSREDEVQGRYVHLP